MVQFLNQNSRRLLYIKIRFKLKNFLWEAQSSFDGAKLTQVDMNRIRGREARFPNLTIDTVDFTAAHMDSADFRFGQLSQDNFFGRLGKILFFLVFA